MKLAVMQPYIFPYIGYFQLIAQADKFIVYDDVNFIKQGWINRNRILLNDAEHLFTIPLKNASSFKLIKDVELDTFSYSKWKVKFYKTLEQAYKKAPYYKEGLLLISETIDADSRTIAELAVNSILKVCQYLHISTSIINTAVNYNNNHLSGEERVIDLCIKENANMYVNPVGGVELYSKENFAKQGIVLKFLQSEKIAYKQFRNTFIPFLSIIDVIMFNDRESIQKFLSNYSLT